MLYPFQVCFCSCLKWQPKGKHLLSPREHLEVRNACPGRCFASSPFTPFSRSPSLSWDSYWPFLPSGFSLTPAHMMPDCARSGLQSLPSRLWGSFKSLQWQQDPGRFQCTAYLRTVALSHNDHSREEGAATRLRDTQFRFQTLWDTTNSTPSLTSYHISPTPSSSW